MSAVTVFLTDDAALMFSDAVTYDNDNRITAIRPKAYPLPHLSCVISLRGPQDFAEDFVPRLARTFASFEALVEMLPLAAEVAWDAASEEVLAYGACEIYLAGWSHARGRAEGWLTSNRAEYGEPWVLREIKDYASAPGVPLDAEPDDLLDAGIAIAEAQRAHRDEDGNGGVGGFLQMTQVTPQAIHTAIVHRWPDMIGDCLRDAA